MFPKADIMTPQRSDLYSRNVLPPSSRDQKPEIREWAGLVPSEGRGRICSGPLLWLLVVCWLVEASRWTLPSCSHRILCVCVCVCLSLHMAFFFIRALIILDWGPTLSTPVMNYIFSDPISPNKFTLQHLGIRTSTYEISGGHDSTHNKWVLKKENQIEVREDLFAHFAYVLKGWMLVWSRREAVRLYFSIMVSCTPAKTTCKWPWRGCILSSWWKKASESVVGGKVPGGKSD